MSKRISSKEIAYCGCLGAAALLLPILFHIVRLGHVFMPMYLPLVLLAFFVRPAPAAVTAFITPLLSATVTGMPPFYPPIAVFMAVELATMGTIIAWLKNKWPNLNNIVILVPTLLIGRGLYIGVVYAFSLVIELPAKLMAGLSILGGWPGIILMIIVIPIVTRIVKFEK